MDQELAKRASHRVEELAAWEPDTFQIAPAEDWNRPQLPLLMAHPTVRRPYSVPVAVLPDGELVTPFDDRAFQRLVRVAFPTPDEADAADLARLAVMFGDFGAPVGELVEAIPVSVRPARAIPGRRAWRTSHSSALTAT